MLRKLFMSILIAASFAFPLATTAATPPLSGLAPSAPHPDPLLAFTDPGDTYPLQAPAKPPAAKPPNTARTKTTAWATAAAPGTAAAVGIPAAGTVMGAAARVARTFASSTTSPSSGISTTASAIASSTTAATPLCRGDCARGAERDARGGHSRLGRLPARMLRNRLGRFLRPMISGPQAVRSRRPKPFCSHQVRVACIDRARPLVKMTGNGQGLFENRARPGRPLSD